VSPVNKIQHALVTSRRPRGGPGDLGRLRIALCAVFAAHGFMFASWAVRVPAIKEQTGRHPILGGLTACAGMLLASLAPDVWLALAGFAATGLGLANLFPAAIARAGRLAGSTGVALTSLLGYGGFLLGPPAIGFLASQAGLRTGLTTLSFLGLAAALIAWLSRDPPALAGNTRTSGRRVRGACRR
jgi:MFS family permease